MSRSLSVSSSSGLPDFCLVYLLVPIELAGALSGFEPLCLLQLLGQILRLGSSSVSSSFLGSVFG